MVCLLSPMEAADLPYGGLATYGDRAIVLDWLVHVNIFDKKQN